MEGAVVETRSDSTCIAELRAQPSLPERYVDCGDGTVYDAVTGLLWLEDATCDLFGSYPDGSTDWANAWARVAELAEGECELTDGSRAGDWRLPTVSEWQVTMNAGSEAECDPALTDFSGSNCSPVSFVGLQQAAFDYCFWSGESDGKPGLGADQAVAGCLGSYLTTCGLIGVPCEKTGYLGVGSKDSGVGGAFAWPVREMR